jgi:cellulase
MKYSAILASATLATLAHSHATVWNLLVNGVDQGVEKGASGYIRTPVNNSPVKDLTSKDLTCNTNNVAVAKSVSVEAGDEVTFQWHHNDNSAADDIIDGSHKGPILVYIAPTASNGAGNVWVKIAEEGYDASTKKWAVDKLKENKGQHSVTLPAGLAAGDYILRAEIIAHHESDTAFATNPARGAQLYPNCAQIKVTSGGSVSLPAGVAIPGVYTSTDPGIVFNLYGSFTSYSIPGPAVWNGVSGGSSPAPAPSSSAAPAPTTTVRPVTTSAAPAPVTTARPTTTQPAPAPVTSSTTSKKAACPAPTTLSTVVKPTPTGGAGVTVAKWGQCGGQNYSGSTTCVSGSSCKVQNPYYSQCL